MEKMKKVSSKVNTLESIFFFIHITLKGDGKLECSGTKGNVSSRQRYQNIITRWKPTQFQIQQKR